MSGAVKQHCAKIDRLFLLVFSLRISILSPGTTSDVHPFIALGNGLRTAGYDVSMASNSSFAKLIESRGMSFVELPGNPEELLASDAGEEFLRSPSSPVELVSRFAKLFFPFLSKCLVSSLPACKGTAAIIASPLAYYGYDIASALRVPFFPCSLIPINPTGEFPFPMIQSPMSVGSFGNQMSYSVSRQVFWQFMRDNINGWRKEYLNLPALGMVDEPTGKMEAAGIPFVYGFSSHVVKRPSDWPLRHQITGFWPLDRSNEFTADAELLDLTERCKPIVFRFGTIGPREQRRLAKVIQQALEIADLQGVLITDQPDQAMKTERLSFAPGSARDWLLKRCSTVVSNCDVEFASAIMRAGKPGIPTPFFADQFYWARKMYSLNIATVPIPLSSRDFAADTVAHALRSSIDEAGLSENCTALSKKLQGEDGIANAVMFFKQKIG